MIDKRRCLRHRERVRALAVLFVVVLAQPVKGQFTDISAAMGTTGAYGDSYLIGGGISVADMDGDDRLDLVVTAFGLTVYRQTEAGVFEVLPDVLADAGVPADLAPSGNLPFDMDGDGDLDLLLVGTNATLLLRNEGAGAFTDVSATHLPGHGIATSAAAPADFDGDGDVDLFVTTYIETALYPVHECGRDLLMLNDGAGRFVDATDAAGIGGFGCGLAVAAQDMDGDGDPDLLVANDFGLFLEPNQYWRNLGPGEDGVAVHFEDASAATGFDRGVYGMGVATGDVNLDGAPDAVTTSIGLPSLVVSGAGGVFADETEARGAGVVFSREGLQVTWGAVLEDFDRDGRLDMVLAGGEVAAAHYLRSGVYQPNVVRRGTVGGFEPAPTWGLDEPSGTGRGLAVGDLDRDGDPDLVIAHSSGSVAVHRNDFPGTLPLRIQLRASETSRDAVGASVEARCGGHTRTVWRVGGGSFAGTSTDELRVAFPAPCSDPGAPIDLRVSWPSGYRQALAATTGGAVTIEEPDWLRFEGGVLRAEPTDESGVPVSSGSLHVRVGGTALGDAPYVDGAFELDLAGATGRVDLTLDGRALGVHPVVGPDLRIVPRPHHVIGGDPITWVLVGRDVETLAGDTAVAVTAGGRTVALSREAGGHWVGTDAVGLPQGPHVATLTLDGLAAGPAMNLVAEPEVDDDRSYIRFWSLYQQRMPFFQVQGVFRDANGRARAIEDDRVEIRIASEARAPTVSASGDGAFDYTVNNSGAAHGARVELTVDGRTVGPAQSLVLLEGPEDIVAYIDPDRSRCAPVMRRMAADGHDVLDFLVVLRDAHGQPLPATPESAPVLVGPLTQVTEVTVRDDSSHAAYGRYAGDGPIEMQIRWHDTLVPIRCTVESFVPSSTEPSSERSELSARPRELDLDVPEITSRLEWRPRDEASRLLGSRAGPGAWSTEIGRLGPGPIYAGLGLWVHALAPNDLPGTDVVRVRVGGSEVETEVTIRGMARDAGLPDGGPVPDGGAPDAGMESDAGADGGSVDGGVRTDDASVVPDGGVEAVEPGGCGCRTERSSGHALLWIGLFMLGRRRRLV